MKCYVNYVLSILGLLFWTACTREEMKVSSDGGEMVELFLQMGSRSGEGRTFLLSQEDVNTISGIHIYLFDGNTNDAKCVQYKYLDYNLETESLCTSLKIDEGLKGKDLTVVVIGMSPNKDTYPLPEGELAVGSLSINDLSLRLFDGMSQKIKETEVFAGSQVFTGGTATVSVDLKRVVAGVICYITDIPAKIDEKNITSMELQLSGGQNTELSLLPDFLSDGFTGKYGSEPNSGYVVLASHGLSEYSDSDNDGLLEIDAQEESTNQPATVADAVFFSAYLLPWQNIRNTESPLKLVLKSGDSAVKEYPVSLKDESGTVSKTYSLDMNQLYAIGAKPVAGSTKNDVPYPLPSESLDPGIHIIASGWEETIEHDVDFPIFGIVVDELPKHLCKGDVVNVKVKGTTVAENYNFVFKPQSGHGEDMNKSYKLNNGIYTIDSSDLVPGEYLVDIYNVVDGALGQPVSKDMKMVVHPVASTWKGGASGKEHDWNTWENWKEGTPYICTDVLIPNGCKYYPELKEFSIITADDDTWYDGNCYCGKIQFDTKAQMKGLCFLKYEEGYVDFPGLAPNGCRLLFPPLKEVYTGDFAHTVYDNRYVSRPSGYEECWPWLDEASYVIDSDVRVKSKLCRRHFQGKPYDKLVWSENDPIVEQLLKLSTADIIYSKDGEFDEKVPFRFPSRHRKYNYYDEETGQYLFTVNIPRNNIGRFYYDNKEINYNAQTQRPTSAFLVGNIFMTGLDVAKFIEKHKTVVILGIEMPIESVQILKEDIKGEDMSEYMDTDIFQSPITKGVIPHGAGFLINIKKQQNKDIYKYPVTFTSDMEAWEE